MKCPPATKRQAHGSSWNKFNPGFPLYLLIKHMHQFVLKCRERNVFWLEACFQKTSEVHCNIKPSFSIFFPKEFIGETTNKIVRQ